MVLPDPRRSRAVLIGTSVYQDESLPDVPSVANNLADLAAVLADPGTGVFAPECCTVVENSTDVRAVARLLTDVASAAEDVLFIYYAGHGILGARRHELYLGLPETDVDGLHYSALSMDWMRDVLLNSRAATKVLVLDCCFSGRGLDDVLADEESVVLSQVGVSGTYTLTSGPDNKPSLAPVGADHTAFSGELLALLRDGVPGGPAELDLLLVYRQLLSRMAEQGWPTPRQRGTDNVHDLALGRNPAHRAVAPEGDGRLLQTLLTDQLSAADLDRLFDRRTLVLNTAVDDEIANWITAELLMLADRDPTADIRLYLNSQGGSVTAGMAIYDTMKFVEPPVTTWAVGLVSGVAQVLLSAGTKGKRYALPHAKILLKGTWAPPPATEPQREVHLTWAHELATIIAEETGQTVERIKADIDQMRWFSAREALEYGLIDHIVARLPPA
jgi:ATP-dependent Clp endopeptidase proteolytic subunit ClpP